MKKSKELAFLNFLSYTCPNHINFENDDATFSFTVLEEKMQLNKQIISEFLTQLREDNFVTIADEEDDKFRLHFQATSEKLFNFLNPHDLDDILEKIYMFISKYSHFFNFNFSTHGIIKTAKKILPLIEKDPYYDISPILREALLKGLSNPYTRLYLGKLLFHLSDKIDEEDQELFGDIVFYFLTIPYEYNPFVTTLFFSKVALQIEVLKKGISWDKIYDHKDGAEALDNIFKI